MKNAVSGRMKTDLPSLYDKLEGKLQSLRSLGRTQKYGYFLTPLDESCLPEKVLAVSGKENNLISDTSDPTVAWKKLLNYFQSNTRARVIGPRWSLDHWSLDEFFNCQILEGEEIGLYAALLRSIVAQLKDAEYPLEDIYQAFQLIRYLPESYEGIKQSIYRGMIRTLNSNKSYQNSSLRKVDLSSVEKI
ncbi:retrovirus-related Pol polyprotein from transposon TNT 1-94 [Trichonephila inaurata madagascariensis]|uniref:Retrovirus-related Pol polyprotein from transposon TNT 1-94 n=1 Tax=Trichonephila inaurata madagascariensis TaxID=2747483 RepID=A0A8X7BST6_9ARAC|nr:retrovirus-related Pol polyprotein from transposon TNT 1-94 [Trichonephila inaurata madagascariensis]